MIENKKTYNGHTYSGVQLDACINGYEQGKADAIDEYFEKMQSVAFGNRKGLVHFKDILIIREQLKEQK